MYYVMELCEGKACFLLAHHSHVNKQSCTDPDQSCEDLFEHMFNTETPRRLEEQKAAEIIQQVVSALQYAHDKGIAHRDT